MAFSPNKELFRSNIKILLEYKWEQTKNWIFLQNIILLTFVIFLILNKIEVVEQTLALFLITMIILIPELKQNWESLKTLFGHEESVFGFEDV